MEHEAQAAFFRVALFGVYFWFFGGGALIIRSYAPKIFICAPKISAVRLKIYIWSHKCSQSQK